MPPHIDTSRHDTSASSLPAAFCLQSLLAARREWGGGWKGQKGKFFPILPHSCWVGGDLYSYLWGDPSSSFSFPLWEGELQRLPHCWSICSVLPALPDRVERRSDAYIARAACRAMKSHIRL